MLGRQSVEETTGLKTWDLKKAYKQLPIHADSTNESYLAVFDPNEGGPKIYGQRVLPFGSRASVHAFCRAATGIWAVGVSGFHLHWTAYFDDFVLIEAEPLQRLSDLCVTTLFTLLGWLTSVDKGSDFSAIACVLGLELNLSDCKLGLVYLQNTEKRKAELAEKLTAIIESGKLHPKDGATVRGRLIFAENQIFGRRAAKSMRTLSRHILSGKVDMDADVLGALKHLKEHVVQGPPRSVGITLRSTMHLYVDASFEPRISNFAGIGGVLVDPLNGVWGHFSCFLTTGQLDMLNKMQSKHPIYELECLAISLGVQTWINLFSRKHIIIFTDNNGSLGAMISGRTANSVAQSLVDRIDAILDERSIIAWFERVNTASNIADLPSRSSDCPLLGPRFEVQVDEALTHALHT